MELNRLLAGDTSKVDVNYADQTVSLLYRKDAYTPKLEAEVMSEANGGGGAVSVADFVVALVEDWDITKDGDPFPPVAENVSTLPLPFLVAVVRAIAKEMAADPLFSAALDAPS